MYPGPVGIGCSVNPNDSLGQDIRKGGGIGVCYLDGIAGFSGFIIIIAVKSSGDGGCAHLAANRDGAGRGVYAGNVRVVRGVGDSQVVRVNQGGRRETALVHKGRLALVGFGIGNVGVPLNLCRGEVFHFISAGIAGG